MVLHRIVVLALVFFLLVGLPASARIDTLEEALEHVSWNRGLLLVVNPGGTRPITGDTTAGASSARRQTPAPELPAPPPGGYRLARIAPLFGRKPVLLGTITALAPTTMTVLSSDPGTPPDRLAGMSPNLALTLLEGTLTPAQWQKLSSANGLGLGDLRADQRALFLALLPHPFRIGKRAPRGSRDGEEEVAILSPARRSSVRVRVHLEASYYFNLPCADKPGTWMSVSQEAGWYYNTPLIARDAVQTPATVSYGRVLAATVPSRLKPGHLPFDAPALNPLVSLADVATVGDLLHRIAKVTGLELHADGRIASLPVWTNAASEAPKVSARAGDVLKALCWAVTGTFRKVSPAYVLTDDIEGIGTRYARLHDWKQGNLLATDRERMAAYQNRRRAAEGPDAIWRYLRFAPEDPLPLPAPVLERLVRHRMTQRITDGPDDHRHFTFSVSELSSGAQAFLRERAALLAEKNIPVTTDAKARSDNLYTVFSYVVPGMGVVGSADNAVCGDFVAYLPEPRRADEPPPGEPVSLPATLATRALLAAPKSPEEARQAVEAAFRHGLNRLWIPLDTPDRKKTLEAAIVAGKEKRISVLAVLPLLKKDALADVTAEEAATAINILGETAGAYAKRLELSTDAGEWGSVWRAAGGSGSDWLRPDAPGVEAALKRRLTEIVSTPGLAGLVVEGIPLGYSHPGSEDWRDSYLAAADVGYAPEARLAFLRQKGYDPVDLYMAQPVFQDEMFLPFFPETAFEPRYIRDGGGQMVSDPNYRNPRQEWNAYRYRIMIPLLSQVHAAIRAAKPSLPLLARSLARVSGRHAFWYGSWDRVEAPPGQGGNDFSGTLARTARRESRFILACARPDDPEDAAAFTADLRQWLRTEGKEWNGVVLDLSDLPMERALALLEKTLALPPPPRPATP